jgi:Domain of unknown function (DUF4349)
MTGTKKLFATAIVAVLLAACSGQGSGSTSSRSKGTEAVAPGGAATSTADAAGIAKDAAAAPNVVPTDGRQVITNATIGLNAKRVGDVAADATAVVTAAGGYLFSENAAVGSRTDAMLVFKVPPTAFTTVMDQLGDLGRPVSKQVTTDDVTAQVVDLEGRLASATGSMNRLRALYDRADTVGDVVAIEAELVKREAEVESLQGQLRVVQAQVTMATVTLTVAKLVPAATPTESASGFFAGLDQGWDALLAATGAAATALGVLLPFLALAAIVGGVALGVRRRRRPTPA